MEVRLLLSSSLRRYVKDYDPVEGIKVLGAKGKTVREILMELGIPQRDVKVVMIDGVHRGMDHVLEGNERVAVFPAIGGG